MPALACDPGHPDAPERLREAAAAADRDEAPTVSDSTRKIAGTKLPTAAVDRPRGEDVSDHFACESDEECVVTKWDEGACCPKGCVADIAMNRQYAQILEAARDVTCTEADRDACPKIDCEQPTQVPQAKCIDGLCTVKMVSREP